LRTVFFDVDTQLDFLFPCGALYAPGAERVTDSIVRLNQFAVRNGIPLISTVDAHGENDPEFRYWPAHCVAGTIGQRKPAGTVVEGAWVVPSHAGAPIEPAPQYLIEKQHLDCFTNPNLPVLLDQLKADRYVVYGVVTEICVRFAAFGLLKTGKPVSLVMDAVRHLDEQAMQAMLREFEEAGGSRTTVEQVAGVL
jgi:nicotinamidase/pyrazinamidase